VGLLALLGQSYLLDLLALVDRLDRLDLPFRPWDQERGYLN
jgi:hypothetical protein